MSVCLSLKQLYIPFTILVKIFFNQGTDIIIKAFLKDVHRCLNSVSNYQDHQILPYI